MTSLHFCTSDSWGGLELYAATLMVELQRAGVTVLTVCKPGSKIHQYLTAHDINCVELPNYRKISFSSVKFLQSFLRRQNVSVVHVHFHSDVWVASLAMKNDSMRRLYLSIYMGVGRKKDIFHRWIYNRVNAIFTSSLEMNSRLPDLYPIDKENIHYLPYGRIVSDYAVNGETRSMIRRRHGIADDELVVGTMVRIDPGKGVMDFIKSMTFLSSDEYRNIRYLVVGEPTRKAFSKPGELPYERHCVEYYQDILAFTESNQLIDKIIFAGYQEDITGYLSAMDIFVFPSRDELYSLVVLDAMCMRLPIVAARAGGNLKQITDNVNGLFYTVSDSEDLASKIMRYGCSSDLRTQHGDAARKFVEVEHSMERIIKKLMLFYA